jgi:hypothetical protein
MHFDGVCSLSNQGSHAKLALQTLLSLLIRSQTWLIYMAVILILPSKFCLLLNV